MKTAKKSTKRKKQITREEALRRLLIMSKKHKALAKNYRDLQRAHNEVKMELKLLGSLDLDLIEKESQEQRADYMGQLQQEINVLLGENARLTQELAEAKTSFWGKLFG